MKQTANRLIKETSPYLLQHAYNPVDWFAWGHEALERAIKEDKPILISIGYSSCHWCHVMERESFEDASTAELMNRYFINIKIDREERPDLDHIYMDAVQAITGSGGWPLNVFLTPNLKPFYGGTYYPPVRAYNRASWREVLHNVAEAYKTKRKEIEEQANNLVEHLQNSNAFGIDKVLKIPVPSEELFQMQMADSIYENIMKAADKEWGGFSNAPKFPQTFTIRYLLQYYHFTKEESALKQACLSLDKMIQGGIFDHIGGGFARYSTDAEWLAPHFEKMLYDNALLVIVLAEAFQLTKNKHYEKAIHETLEFIEEEMTSAEEGFYSALDADSEGVEGKYYTWAKEEITEILKADADLFCQFYDITEKGNWEETNIPRIKKPLEIFCRENGLDEELFALQLKQQCKQLHQVRKKRVRPLLDDKVILGWNALMNSAYSKAFQATGLELYRQKAVRNMSFLLTAFKDVINDSWCHVYKNKQAKVPAFLDDYAWLIQALIDLQEITSDSRYLVQAGKITEHVISFFSEEGSGFFFYTPANAPDVIFRKKEVYDGAVPSGNSVMAANLHYLGIIFNRSNWVEQSVQMLNSLQNPVIRYPVSFGNWNRHLLNLVKGYKEIAVVGKGFQKARDEVNKWYQPNKIIQAAQTGNEEFPLLAGKKASVETPIFFLCKNYSCRQPVENVKEFELILREERL